MLLQTSTDGETWTTRYTTPAPFALTDLTLSLYAGYWGAGNHEDKSLDWESVYITSASPVDPGPVDGGITVRDIDGTRHTAREWDGATGRPVIVREWVGGTTPPNPDPEPPTTPGGTFTTGLPRQVFSPDSFWYKPLPDD